MRYRLILSGGELKHFFLSSFQDLWTNLIVLPMTLFVLPAAPTRAGLIPSYFSMLLLVLDNPKIAHLLTAAFQFTNSARRDLVNVD